MALADVKMSDRRQEVPPQQVVAADEVDDRLRGLVALLRDLGHVVIAAETDLGAVRSAIEQSTADLAVVAVHGQPTHALQLVEVINDTARCPIVLMLDEDDSAMIREALERGLDAYATSYTAEALESAIALARTRFDELESLGRHVRDLEAGVERRARIEQAKGVLMERYGIGEREAYERLRQHARSHRVTLHDVAQAVLRARGVLLSDQ